MINIIVVLIIVVKIIVLRNRFFLNWDLIVFLVVINIILLMYEKVIVDRINYFYCVNELLFELNG